MAQNNGKLKRKNKMPKIIRIIPNLFSLEIERFKRILDLISVLKFRIFKEEIKIKGKINLNKSKSIEEIIPIRSDVVHLFVLFESGDKYLTVLGELNRKRKKTIKKSI